MAKLRQGNHEARFAALSSRAAQAVETMDRPLPAGSQIVRLGVVPTLFEMVHAALPKALQTDQNYALLQQELDGERLAENGARFIGSGEHVLPQLEGSSTTWNYRCRVRVSLSVAEQPDRVTAMTGAGMAYSRRANSAVTRNKGVTSGPTVSALAVAGTQPGIGQPGGSATANAAYKRETTKGFSQTLGHERSDNFTFPEGASLVETQARLRVRIDWDKRPRALATWARGQAHKELTMDGLGWSSSDGTRAHVLDFENIFAKVPLTYAAPGAPSVAEAGTSTSAEGEIWV
ncbi:hypothetical protein ACFP1Z_19185 [Streptomyces gamaensis]|uniref:Uncharacterized protein n=1 Tax=Streptomyces gamaensis TaxID=1763542 RepID=A0ABW0Z324_9ACTN